jgi:plastocyanin
MPRRTYAVVLSVAIAAITGLASLAGAADFQILQKDKTFRPGSLKVKVGDTVDFRNEDDIFHNVFSLSDTKSFDLGSYPKGQGRKVTFDKPGSVEVECSIHPDMHMKIEVTQ